MLTLHKNLVHTSQTIISGMVVVTLKKKLFESWIFHRTIHVGRPCASEDVDVSLP